MDRLVAREFIDAWIDRNSPDGISRLAIESGVSSSTISKVRIGIVPKKAGTRVQLARALNVAEERLFPKLALRRGRTS
jgi:transcriptional regulator with XRE-family HTH domain